jgi:NADH:ubiquinone oxidoreductase subunit H
MLLMIFLVEYSHLVISSIHTVIFFLGGWYTLNYFWFLPPVFLAPHDTYYFSELFLNL